MSIRAGTCSTAGGIARQRCGGMWWRCSGSTDSPQRHRDAEKTNLFEAQLFSGGDHAECFCEAFLFRFFALGVIDPGDVLALAGGGQLFPLLPNWAQGLF